MQAYAELLDDADIAAMLAGILQQEVTADATLTTLAEGSVNAAAA